MQTRFQAKTVFVFTLLSISTLIGCSTTNVIPATGDQILDTYRKHTAGTDETPRMFRELRNNRRDLRAYTRDSSNEISQTFPRLPNPELSLYVFPHFTRKGHPVPGYSSAFLLYEKSEYALPGELIQ